MEVIVDLILHFETVPAYQIQCLVYYGNTRLCQQLGNFANAVGGYRIVETTFKRIQSLAQGITSINYFGYHIEPFNEITTVSLVYTCLLH
jgi:hypothetical protein